MADLTYTQAKNQNELVPGTPGANQQQITGAEIVGATSSTSVDSGWTFTNFKSWIKLDATYMDRTLYDSDADGTVGSANELKAGGQTVTTSEARTHIDDTSIHFVINDTVAAGTVAWSSSKISTELSAKLATGGNVGTGEGTIYQGKTGTQFNLKTLKQAGNLTITNGTSEITISASGEANTAANVGVGDGTIFRDKVGTVLNFKRLQAGTNVTLTNNANEVVINASGTTNLSNAIFPDWAGFQVQGSTTISVGGTTNINFSASNKHALSGTGATTIGTFTFPTVNAHYSLLIPAAITISSVTATGKQEYGQNDLTAGKAHIMSIYWDGTTAHWQTSESP